MPALHITQNRMKPPVLQVFEENETHVLPDAIAAQRSLPMPSYANAFPPCHAAIRTALAYLQQQTAAFPGPWSPLFACIAWRTAEAAVDAAALDNDLPATQAACRQWWALAIAYAQGGALERLAQSENPQGALFGQAVPHG
jgi:hypothetical protein